VNRINLKHNRVLAIAPSTRGFGFAVVEGQETLVDWGVKSVKGDKNTGSFAKVAELIVQYQPEVMVLQNNSVKDSRRSVRIKELGLQIIALAANRNVRVALFSRKQVRRVFFTDGQGTKHALAEILAKRFPEELGFRLPPKRRPWMSEDYRMDIFEAVSLALTFLHPKRRTTR
jgi:Holliday junction resolvasome RuvABC endonuclease subunit